MAGYCNRCGNVVPGVDVHRCKCGGLATATKSSKVLSVNRPVAPEGSDAWSRRYIQKTKSPAGTPRKQRVNDNNEDATPKRDTSSNPYADLQRKLSKKANHLNIPAMSPRLEDQVEETITRAFGSVLDPKSSRSKWACAICHAMFLRDQTVYPDPRAKDHPSLSDTLYCPPCFNDNFSIGHCEGCGYTVLPDAAYPFIQQSNMLWHAACYACLYCSKDLSKTPQVDLYGNPCCSHCFDTAAFLKSPTVERVPALLSAGEPPRSGKTGGDDRAGSASIKQRKLAPEVVHMGPAVKELRGKLEQTGLEGGSITESALELDATKSEGDYFKVPRLPTSHKETLSGPKRTDYSFPRPLPSPRMDLKGSSRPLASPEGKDVPDAPIPSTKCSSHPIRDASSSLARSPVPAVPASPWKVDLKRPELRRQTSSSSSLHDSVTHASKGTAIKTPQSGIPPQWMGLGLRSPELSSPALPAVPMQRAHSDRTPSASTGQAALPLQTLSPPQAVSRPTHRVSRSVASLQSVFSSQEPSSTQAMKSRSQTYQQPHSASILPTSPVLANIARFEQAGVAHAKEVSSPRPQRSGRTQSMFAVPTLEQLKKDSTPSAVRARPVTRAETQLVSAPAASTSIGGAKVSLQSGRTTYAASAPEKHMEAHHASMEIGRNTIEEDAVPDLQALRKKLSKPDFSRHGVPQVPAAQASRENAFTAASRSEAKLSSAASAVISADSRCSGCQLRLFVVGSTTVGNANSKIVTLTGTQEKYHARCFVCSECKKPFEDGVFVELDDGKKAHEKCAPRIHAILAPLSTTPLKLSSEPVPSRPRSEQTTVTPKPFRSSASAATAALSQQQAQHGSAAQVTPLSPSKMQIKVLPRPAGPTKLSKASEVFASSSSASSSPTFGGLFICHGCGDSGSMAETTLGPVGTRFHHRCLKCACGKKLDSGAKSIEMPSEGGEPRRRFACRDCIDKDRLAKRSLSSATSLGAARGRI